MIIQSKILSNISQIRHGFGTANEAFPKELESFSEPQWKQVHSDLFAQVIEPNQNCGEVDALYTRVPRLVVSVKTADCVPILLSHSEGKTVAAIHAGWRGTKARILQKLWKQLSQEGENPQDWVAVIGPCIRSCCYEVSEELINGFKSEFSQMDCHSLSPQHRKLDLQAINFYQLQEVGFQQIEIIEKCTHCCVDPLFQSYRRDSMSKARQYSAIGIN